MLLQSSLHKVKRWIILHWTPYIYLSDKIQTPYTDLGDKLWTSYTDLSDSLRTSYRDLGDNRHEDFNEKVKNEDESDLFHHFHHVHCDLEVFFHHICWDKFSLNSPFNLLTQGSLNQSNILNTTNSPMDPHIHEWCPIVQYIFLKENKKNISENEEQAGAELGQAHLKLGLGFTSTKDSK